jgi:hypothetical protein
MLQMALRVRIINHQRRRIYMCASAVPLPDRPTFRFLKSHPNFDKLFVRKSERASGAAFCSSFGPFFAFPSVRSHRFSKCITQRW